MRHALVDGHPTSANAWDSLGDAPANLTRPARRRRRR